MACFFCQPTRNLQACTVGTAHQNNCGGVIWWAVPTVHAADAIEWSTPRLLCIAGDFTKYDEHAVQQINRNIELIRYRKYGEELLLLGLVNATAAIDAVEDEPVKTQYKTVSENLTQAKPGLRDRYEELCAYALALGDDVQQKTLKFYFAFKRLKNFACVEIYNQAEKILVYVKIDPNSVDLEGNQGFLRDVRSAPATWKSPSSQLRIWRGQRTIY